MRKLRVAMAAWEIGRITSGLGTKIGGLGVILEELPSELVRMGKHIGIELEIVILSPCFGHYDKTKLKATTQSYPATIDEHTFEFTAYENVFEDGQRVVYFWDEWLLHWTNATHIYPSDPQLALNLYAALSQAMAGYIRKNDFDCVHLHDYHLGLIPFYLDDDYLSSISVHLTIHNATYQGITPLSGGGFNTLDRLELQGEKLFHHYFDFFDQLNLLKACMLKVHEQGGKITTVSGDLAASWGYAAELKQSHAEILAKAQAQKAGPVGAVFVPNGHLDLFEKLPIIGITNGLSNNNRPENLPEFKAKFLSDIQHKRGKDLPFFHNELVQQELLERDHNFDAHSLEQKAQLKRLLHLEVFGTEPIDDPILIALVGRLVAQKNLGLVADIAERMLAFDPGVKFVILASAPTDDKEGQATEREFKRLAKLHPHRIYLHSTFNQPLSKLVLAGGDFALLPSRFEPAGLVDYEASLLGNVVIGRLTGGLAKVRSCAYLYEWLDISDRAGEANAFFEQICIAVDTYRKRSKQHEAMMRKAMAIDASWDRSATQYILMYLYGHLAKRWQAERRQLLTRFLRTMETDCDLLPMPAPAPRDPYTQPPTSSDLTYPTSNRELFAMFFQPAKREFGDHFDWQLKKLL